MKIFDLYNDYHINHKTEGHKHCRPGWVNTSCPFCTGNPGYHLGYSLEDNYFRCWRCGWHSKPDTIAALLGISKTAAIEIIKEYGGRSRKLPNAKPNLQKKPFKFPSQTGPLEDRHMKYLKDRGFDPIELIHTWGLFGTGPVSKLDKIHYKNRILIPIYWNNKVVSFQTRSITSKTEIKYKACPKDREIIHHKHIIYKHPAYDGTTGICVEGVADVWKLGIEAFATFGVEYKNEQLLLMAKLYRNIAVIFDNDPAGIKNSKKLVADLHMLGVEAFRVDVKTDPGSMTKKEVKKLKHMLRF